MGSRFFSKLKILDFTGELGPYATKLFAGLGADVIHLEPIKGDPLRLIGPFYNNKPSLETGLQHLYYNSGKRGMAFDITKPAGKQIFLRLCSQADLLVESFAPGVLQSLGLSYATLSKQNNKLVHTSITPFGHTGPMSQYPASDLTCAALSGFLYLAGVDNEKPVRSPDNQTYRMAEAFAGVGSAIALLHAARTGQGQFIDAPCIEAAASAMENAAQFWDLEGKVRRGRGREAGNATIHPCLDGHIALLAIIGRNRPMWDNFVQWMREENVENWKVFDDSCWTEYAFRTSEEGYAIFCETFEAYAKTKTKAYLYQIGQHYKVSITPVCNGKDLLENEQLRYRGYWHTEYNTALGGELTYPSSPYEFSEMNWEFYRNAPRLGEHTVEILKEIGYSATDIAEHVKNEVVYAE